MGCFFRSWEMPCLIAGYLRHHLPIITLSNLYQDWNLYTGLRYQFPPPSVFPCPPGFPNSPPTLPHIQPITLTGSFFKLGCWNSGLLFWNCRLCGWALNLQLLCTTHGCGSPHPCFPLHPVCLSFPPAFLSFCAPLLPILKSPLFKIAFPFPSGNSGYGGGL